MVRSVVKRRQTPTWAPVWLATLNVAFRGERAWLSLGTLLRYGHPQWNLEASHTSGTGSLPTCRTGAT